MVGTTCAFTGHRPHKFPWKDNEADPRCIALKETLARQIATLAGAGVTEYFTGGADGTDCWAAEIVLDLREKNPALKLRCVLPYGGQADRWSDSARERYHSILKRADSVDYVSRQYYDGCMIDRNHRLVESAGLLLAVFSGESTVNAATAAKRHNASIFLNQPSAQPVVAVNLRSCTNRLKPLE